MTAHAFPAVIAVGASAGGVEALGELVALLPAALAAPVLVVLHIAPAGTSVLPDILDRRSGLDVRAAQDGEPLRPGRGYVAPADVHLAVGGGCVRLTDAPPESGHRPAVDPLLRAVSAAYGTRAVGVVLSGAQDDGARGLADLQADGGVAIVQDPGEAGHPSMPEQAHLRVPGAEVLGLAEIAQRLIELSGRTGAR